MRMFIVSFATLTATRWCFVLAWQTPVQWRSAANARQRLLFAGQEDSNINEEDVDLSVMTDDSSTARVSSSRTRPIAITEPTATMIESSNRVAEILRVKPGSRLPRVFWRYSWRVHNKILPLLHIFDMAMAKDLDKSLRCLWCKALASQDVHSPCHDIYDVAYDLLPSFTRRILKIPYRLFPRLIHSNIEMRTAYLDRSLREQINDLAAKQMGGRQVKVRLVTLGAGYDTRSIRMLNDKIVHEAFELDMPTMVESKRLMMKRLQQRRSRRQNADCALPTLVPSDLNDLTAFERILEDILSSSQTEGSDGNDFWHTVFVSEGVMIYLDEGVPSKMLRVCSNVARRRDQNATFLFSDLLRNVPIEDDAPDDELAAAIAELENTGWELIQSSWFVKPVWARHMGTARLMLAREERAR